MSKQVQPLQLNFEQCYKCKQLCTERSICAACEDKIVCYNCYTDFYLSETQSCMDAYCSDHCLFSDTRVINECLVH